MRAKRSAILLLAVLAAVLLTACTKNELGGRWTRKNENNKVEVSFKKNGDMEVKETETRAITYEVIDGEVIIKLKGTNNVLQTLKLDGNTLTDTADGAVYKK